MDDRQLKKLILEKKATIKDMPKWHVDIHNKVATVETEKGFLAQSNAKLFSSPTPKEAKSARTGDYFIEAISPMYLRLALRV